MKSGRAINDGTAPYDPGYYQTECAPVSQKTNGKENNSALIKFLIDNGYLDFKKDQYLKNGIMVDPYGNPIIFRFLVQPDSTKKPAETVYIWSYGRNGVNEINASPIYKNKGVPDYDSVEVKNMNSGDGGDNICNWR
jgi:hypothetical protein